METRDKAATEKLLNQKRSTYNEQVEFHGTVKELSQSLDELSNEMVWLLDALEKAHPNLPELKDLWKNALSTDKLATKLREEVFFGTPHQ